jgi:hypothetical protein
MWHLILSLSGQWDTSLKNGTIKIKNRMSGHPVLKGFCQWHINTQDYCVSGPDPFSGVLYQCFSTAGPGLVPGTGINYTGPSSYGKKNLPGCGLKMFENHCSI